MGKRCTSPDTITVEPPWRGDALQTQTPFADVYEQRDKLFHNAHELTKILATFVGRLETKAHFKMDRRSVWPLAYGGSAVRVEYVRVEDIEAAPLTADEGAALDRAMGSGLLVPSRLPIAAK